MFYRMMTYHYRMGLDLRADLTTIRKDVYANLNSVTSSHQKVSLIEWIGENLELIPVSQVWGRINGPRQCMVMVFPADAPLSSKNFVSIEIELE